MAVRFGNIHADVSAALNVTDFTDVDTLDELVEALDDGTALAKAIEATVDVYKAVIRERLEAVGFVKGQAYTLESGVGVLYTARKSPKQISRELLVMEQVDPELIDRCTTGGEDGKPFVQIQRPKKKGEKGGTGD
jgi:hypothetical protein